MPDEPSLGLSAAPQAAGAFGRPGRLLSLDALRGFDMFWIIGGSGLAQAVAKATHWRWADWLAEQMHHPEWNGFLFYDLIFPLFLFISGVTMPFSFGGRLEAGGSRRPVYLRVLRRSLLLVLLGLVCNGLLKFEFATLRYPSVLGRIGIAYGLAAIIVLNAGVRGRVLWMVGLLLGYWAAMTLIPVPGVGAGVLTMDGSLAGYIDRTVLPGRLYKGVHDPEGLLSTVPAVATALLGALAGTLLRAHRPRPIVKVLLLLLAGAVGLGLGKLWDPLFPINKNLWSSSFVLYAGGWSLLFLALFYLVIDVGRLRRWAFVFVVIGLNPITIYLTANRLIDFNFTARFLFDGILKHVGDAARPVCWSLAVLLIEWLFLYFLYRKKVFLKV